MAEDIEDDVEELPSGIGASDDEETAEAYAAYEQARAQLRDSSSVEDS